MFVCFLCCFVQRQAKLKQMWVQDAGNVDLGPGSSRPCPNLPQPCEIFTHAKIIACACLRRYLRRYLPMYVHCILTLHTIHYITSRHVTSPRLASPRILNLTNVRIHMYIYIYIYTHTIVYIQLLIYIYIYICNVEGTLLSTPKGSWKPAMDLNVGCGIGPGTPEQSRANHPALGSNLVIRNLLAPA